jgi:L-alanine-DL-glutamate epimerase-like enolase superfamily enzyme
MAVSIVNDLRVVHVHLVYREPVRSGQDWTTERDAAVVRLTDAEGRTGVGEALTPPTTSAVAEVLSWVVGRDAAELVAAGGAWSLGRWSTTLVGAVDSAIVDLAAQAAGVPAARLLGAEGTRSHVAVNALLVETQDVASALYAARALVQEGYRALKVKLEAGEDGAPAAWWAPALGAIRSAVGPGVALRLDLNGALTEAAALSWLPRLVDVALEYVEQPIPAELGTAALARVRATGIPVAADEAVADARTATALLDAGACDVLVVKPGRVGGPLAAMAVARAAAERGVAVTISTLLETGVGLAAAVHVAAALPGDRAHGLATAGLLAADPARGLPPVEHGRIAIPGPGLGVTLA